MIGLTDNGQLGIGHTIENKITVPELVSFHEKIAQIACGAGHCIALTVNRKVYTWGCNVLGQLGLGDCETRWSPSFVETIGNI